jgi:leader peptidase (prepilin peptidase) / N-methyltransferase
MSTTELKPGASARPRDARTSTPDARSRVQSAPVIAATLVLAALVAVAQSSLTDSVLRGALVLVVVPCALIDLERRIIPNRITGPAALFALIAGLALDPGGEPKRLLWAAIAGGFLLIASLASPAGMGMGDVKLLAVMGLLLGPPAIVALLVALLGNIVGALVISSRRGVKAALKSSVPFGPYLAVGGIFAAFLGDALIHLYLHG